MDDARRAEEARLSGTARSLPPPLSARPWPGAARLPEAIDALLRQGRPAEAVATAADARRRGITLSWGSADRVARAYLHLGEPAAAQRVWREATGPPGEATRTARLADADFAAWDLDAASTGYRRAAALDASLADAWLGLALVALERGRASEALAASQRALGMTLETRRRGLLEEIASLAARYTR
jgi:tetratricopeptide (TPR) repeat protein